MQWFMKATGFDAWVNNDVDTIALQGIVDGKVVSVIAHGEKAAQIHEQISSTTPPGMSPNGMEYILSVEGKLGYAAKDGVEYIQIEARNLTLLQGPALELFRLGEAARDIANSVQDSTMDARVSALLHKMITSTASASLVPVTGAFSSPAASTDSSDLTAEQDVVIPEQNSVVAQDETSVHDDDLVEVSVVPSTPVEANILESHHDVASKVDTEDSEVGAEVFEADAGLETAQPEVRNDVEASPVPVELSPVPSENSEDIVEPHDVVVVVDDFEIVEVTGTSSSNIEESDDFVAEGDSSNDASTLAGLLEAADAGGIVPVQAQASVSAQDGEPETVEPVYVEQKASEVVAVAGDMEEILVMNPVTNKVSESTQAPPENTDKAAKANEAVAMAVQEGINRLQNSAQPSPEGDLEVIHKFGVRPQAFRDDFPAVENFSAGKAAEDKTPVSRTPQTQSPPVQALPVQASPEAKPVLAALGRPLAATPAPARLPPSFMRHK